VNGLVQTLRNLGTVRLTAMAVVAAVTIAFFAFLTTRLAAPGYGLLYSDLDLRDSGQIVQKLEAMSVPYQLRGDGTAIMVPMDQVARIRMSMAEQGLPQGGSVGYEIFDKSSTFGTSSFVQNIDQVRALEGELARSISSINLIDSARVHLVLPRRELFARDRQTPTASIVVRLRGAQSLTRNQVSAIQHLVAAAVPGLQPTRVSIIDTNGNLLARGDGGSPNTLAGGNAEEVRVNYENRLARNVQELLERSLGPGKVRVDVHADMDFGRTTTNTETYDPNGQVPRSTQTVTETHNSSDSGDQPVSVSTNLPNSQTATSSGGKTQSSRNEETTNYEISKTVSSRVREGGIVKRLSVAVLLDGTYVTANGKSTYKPRSAAELQQITSLVKSAIGYDAKRGDTVDVVNLPFAGVDEPMPVASPNFMGFEKSDLLRLGETLVLALVAVLVILLVIRPLINRMLESGSTASAAGNDLANLLTGAVAGATPPALPAPAVPGQAAAAPGAGNSLAPTIPRGVPEISEMIDIGQVEGRVAASSIRKIGEIVEKHPEEAVAIMRSWMYQGA
jgi:flagellar M-ring protein FliF